MYISFLRSENPRSVRVQVNYMANFAFEDASAESSEMAIKGGDMLYIEKMEEGWCPQGPRRRVNVQRPEMTGGSTI